MSLNRHVPMPEDDWSLWARELETAREEAARERRETYRAMAENLRKGMGRGPLPRP